MNKIFKVIWNHTAQRFVVVSELTKSNGKSSSTDNRVEPSKALFALGVAGATLLGTTDAMAALYVAQPKVGSSDVISSGTNAGGKEAPLYISTPKGNTFGTTVLIGENTSNKNDGGGSVIIGHSAKGDNLSVVIGKEAKSEGQQDVVIGAGAEQRNTSSKSYSTAIGREAIVDSNGLVAVAIGYQSLANNSYATTIGANSVANGTAATAIGHKALALGNSGVAVGFGANASGPNSQAIGVNSCATMDSALAFGSEAKSFNKNTVAIGSKSEASAVNGSVAIGWSAGVLAVADSGVALGPAAKSRNVRAIAIGRSTWASGADSTAMGQRANTEAGYSIAIGYNANVTVATATNSIAMGNVSTVSGSNSISIGPNSNVTGNTSIAVGAGNVVTGNNSGVFGDPSYITGNASYAVGNNNTITTDNTFVLGSGINRHDTVLTNLSGTVANSVYLGADSEVTAGAATTAGSLKANTSTQTTGAATTAGAIGTVTSATVGSLTYSGFQGATSVGGVAVGAAGTERRIQSLAAGEISATSTDAINGSQLYAVAAEVAKGFNVTSSDGTSNVNILPGKNVQFVNGTLTTANVKALANDGASVTFDVDKGTFNATQTGALIANTSDTGVATVADVADAVNAGYWNVGNKDAVVNNVNFGDDVRFLNGTNTTVTVAADGKDRTNITIDTDFSKLPTQNTATANITNNAGTISVDVNMGEGSVNGDTGVASVNNGDTNKVANISNVVKLVNEAGWNIFQDSDASENKKDLVKAGDNIVFAKGANTTVSVETSNGGKTTTVKYDVDLSNVNTALANTSLTVENGKVSTPTEGGKLVNATTVANAINNSGWQTTLTDGNVETINPGDKVNYVNGKNTKANVVANSDGGVDVTFDVNTGTSSVTTDGKAEADTTNGDVATITDVVNTINKSGFTLKSSAAEGTKVSGDNEVINPGDVVDMAAGKNMTVKQEANGKITFATAADVDFNSVTVGNKDNKITIGNVGGKNVIGNLDTTITAPTTSNNPAAKPTGDALKNAATLGDVLNAGWNLQENGNARDVVTPYDTVNFVNGTATTANVTTKDGVSNVTFNVNVDDSTIKVNADGKLYAIQPTTTVDGKQVGGNITFGDTTTANVTTNDAGDIVVNVNTGDSNATKDGKATAITDKQGNPVNKVVAADGSVTYTDEDGKSVAADDVVDSTEKVATVGDIVDTINKTGWKATSGQVGTGLVFGTKEELINPSEVVTFQAGDNMVLTQAGNVFTYSVNPDPVFNTTTAKAGMTIGEGDTAVNMTPTKANVVNGKVTPAVDMNGATFTNISSNLPNTTSVGNNPTITGPITAQEAADLAKTSGSNAATLNDVLNAGWTLQENDKPKDFVKPFDTVNFKNGKGTTANITSDGSVSNVSYSVNVDNTTTEITYVSKDAKGNNTKVYLQADGSYNTARDGSGTKVDAATITGNQVSAILPTFNGNSTAGNVNFANSTTADINYNSTTGNVTVDVKTGTSSVSDGSATDADGNKIAAGKAVADTTKGTVATIADVVGTINSVYHSVNSTKVADTNGESTYKVTEESKIGAGDVVNYNAGQNIKISGEGNNINISTTENVTFTNANVTNNLTVDGNTTVNNFTVKPNSTIDMGNNIIGNVEAGVKGTDAVNVSQLNATKDAFNWKVTGNNNASNATAVGNQTVSFNNGAGTTAVVEGTNVTYNVNVDDKTTEITYTNKAGDTVYKLADGTYNTQKDGKGTVVNEGDITNQVSVAFGNVAANTTTGTAEGDISPRVASTGDVANAINGSGWKTTDKDGKTLLVNPGDTVNYVNGNGTTANITTSKDASGKDVVDVTFDVKTANATTTNANGSIAAPTATDGANFVNATTLVNTVNNASWNVNSAVVEGTTGKLVDTSDKTASKVKAGDTVNVNAGNNIEITRNGNNIAVATSMTPTFTSVQVGGATGPVISSDVNGDVKVAKKDGSAAKITNVAPGTADTDAVNVSQLKQVAGDIHNKINRNNKDLRAGIAGANAAAGLPQVYTPGRSMVAASVGAFKGQSALAVGYSRASDNGKLILKLQGNANSRGDVGGSVGMGYQW